MTDIAASSVPIQQESLQVNQPVSESANASIGGAINYLLFSALPVGSVVDSVLTEVQFQAQINNPSPATWIIADGRSVIGSTYQSITGNANVPDLRGVFTRGCDNSPSGQGTRGLDPNGVLAPGTYVADQLGQHQHVSDGYGRTNLSPPFGSAGSSYGAINASAESFTSPIPITSLQGGAETAPKYVVVYKFIRIN